MIRALQAQLAVRERELADQKWILQQYLQSPSWRLTAPLRWIARQIRALRALLVGAAPRTEAPAVDSSMPSEIDQATADSVSSDFKELLASHHRLSLENLLASRGRLRLPADPDP